MYLFDNFEVVLAIIMFIGALFMIIIGIFIGISLCGCVLCFRKIITNCCDNDNDNNGFTAKKPVIRLYTKQETNFDIKLHVPKSHEIINALPIGTTISDGVQWKGIINPNGVMKFTNYVDSNYIFFEYATNKLKENNPDYTITIPRENFQTIMNIVMETMGFKIEDRTDFITFWYPELQKKIGKFLTIRLYTREYNKNFPLEISPHVNGCIRLMCFFEIHNSETKFTNIQTLLPSFEQEHVNLDGDGLLCSEWGGMLI